MSYSKMAKGANRICFFGFVCASFILLSSTEASFEHADTFEYSTNIHGDDSLALRQHDHSRQRRDAADNDTLTTTVSGVPQQPTTQRAPTTAANQRTTTPPRPTTSGPYPEFVDSHKYYTSSVIQDGVNLWRNLDPEKDHSITHATLSDRYRTAVAINLPFAVSFYGHPQSKVTIATGGFLYMDDFLHKFLTATQYIAPLMANFDARLGADSVIKYQTNNEEQEKNFIVEWDNLQLKDQTDLGKFSFQAQLYQYGKIVFAYKQVPVSIPTISTSGHPVKIGMSDAYYSDRYDPINGMKRRTIYEYHKVQVNTTFIKSGSAVIFTPLPTCNIIKTCDQCLSTQLQSFKCGWCATLSRCSDGMDRGRQDWQSSGCAYEADKQDCSYVPPTKAPISKTTKKPDLLDISLVGGNSLHIKGLGMRTNNQHSQRRTFLSSPSTLTDIRRTLTGSGKLTTKRVGWPTIMPKTSGINSETPSAIRGPCDKMQQGKDSTTKTTSRNNKTDTTTTTVMTKHEGISATTPSEDLSTQQPISKMAATIANGYSGKRASIASPTNPFKRVNESSTTFPLSFTVTSGTSSEQVYQELDASMPRVPVARSENVPGAGQIDVDAPFGKQTTDQQSGVIVGIIFGVIVLLMLVIGFVGWVIFAYRNPETRSGQWLIRNRPREVAKKIKFWKKSGDTSGEKYAVSMDTETKA